MLGLKHHTPWEKEPHPSNRRTFLRWALSCLPFSYKAGSGKAPLVAGGNARRSAAKEGEIFIDDLDRFLPRAAVNRNYRPGSWWWRNGVQGARGGSLLTTGKWREERSTPLEVEQDAPGAADNYVSHLVPSLRIEPEVHGWHRISFGIYSRARPPRTHVDLLPFRFGARLSNDPFPVFIQGRDDVPDGFQEIFWKVADLTGQAIELTQLKAEGQRPGMGIAAGIDYIRLEPLTPAEALTAKYAQENPPPNKTRLFALMDYVVEVQLLGSFETADDIRAIVYRHQEAGFGRIYWRCYGSCSDHSFRIPEAAARWSDADEKAYCQKYNVKAGWMPYFKACERFDPLKVAADYGKSIGTEIHAWVRMNNHRERPPRSNFWHDHPEFHLIQRDGTRLVRVLSFAHPEVRAYYVSLMKDIASTGVSGILLDWLRHPPAVGYEDSVCDAFLKTYGFEMKSVPENDKRISIHHSQYVNMFLRDLRKALNLSGSKIEISARIRNMNEFGLDAAAWVKEGLVDTIVEGNWGRSAREWSNDPRDVEKGVLSVTRGSSVKAYVIAETSKVSEPLETRQWFSSEDIVKYAQLYRSKGVDRFGLYESTIFNWYPHVRRAIWEAGRVMAAQTTSTANTTRT